MSLGGRLSGYFLTPSYNLIVYNNINHKVELWHVVTKSCLLYAYDFSTQSSA